MLFKRSIAIILSLFILASTMAVVSFVNADNITNEPNTVYDFEAEQNLPYTGMQYVAEQTENGTNRFMSLTIESGSGYPVLAFRTNYILSKNVEYTVTMKYKLDMKATSTGKATTYFNRKLRPVLGNSAENSYFYQCGAGYSMDDANLYAPGINDGMSLVNTSEWKEVSVTFDTTESADKINDNVKYLGFVLQLSPDKTMTLCIDDIAVYGDDEILSGDSEYVAPRIMDDETLGKNTLYVADADNNIVTDYSFESGNGNWQSITDEGTLSLTNEKAHNGSKALKFLAQNLENDKWSYAYFDVEPYTDYYLSVWTLGENWSKTNKNDMRFGIADTESGYFILHNTAREYTQTEQLTCTAWDGEWHLINLKFNSGSCRQIAFAVKGKESVAYFDELSIFKDSDKKKYKAYHEALADAEFVSDDVGGLTDCRKGTNAVENSSFSDMTNIFWQSGENFGIYNDDEMHYYGNFIDITDTGALKGNALHYKENTSVTGVALHTYYMKWIDVTPKTEYTFSADVLIIKSGGGAIKIVDNNQFFPNTVKTVSFDSESSNWQKYAFKFNTGGHNKIGFFVLDGGGEAYIDNIRIFKTADAVEETESSYEISSDKYTVSNGVISGIAPETTIAEVLSQMDNNQYLRVYLDGVEIKDTNQFIRTNMEIRYMDDVAVYSTAKVAVDCDAGGICSAGINLLENGGFEKGKIGWGAIYNGIGTMADSHITNEVVKKGDYAAVINGYVNNYPYISTRFAAKANTDYTISFWIKSNCNTQFRLSDGVIANAGWQSKTAIEGYNEKVIGGKAEWTKISYSFNSGNITSGDIGVIFRRGASNGTIYIDDVVVYEKECHEFKDGKCINCKVTEFDYNADGVFDLRDIVRLKKYLADSNNPIVSGHDDNGIIDSVDLVKVKKKMLDA